MSSLETGRCSSAARRLPDRRAFHRLLCSLAGNTTACAPSSMRRNARDRRPSASSARPSAEAADLFLATPPALRPLTPCLRLVGETACRCRPCTSARSSICVRLRAMARASNLGVRVSAAGDPPEGLCRHTCARAAMFLAYLKCAVWRCRSPAAAARGRGRADLQALRGDHRQPDAALRRGCGTHGLEPLCGSRVPLRFPGIAVRRGRRLDGVVLPRGRRDRRRPGARRGRRPRQHPGRRALRRGAGDDGRRGGDGRGLDRGQRPRARCAPFDLDLNHIRRRR